MIILIDTESGLVKVEGTQSPTVEDVRILKKGVIKVQELIYQSLKPQKLKKIPLNA